MSGEELVKAVEAGEKDRVPELLRPLGDVERRGVVPELKRIRAELRTTPMWEDAPRARRVALLVAGAGCHTGAAAAAAWIGGRDLRGWWELPDSALIEVVRHRDPGWLGDLARRLADRSATAGDDYRLIRRLSVLAGEALPVTDGVVAGWSRDMDRHAWERRGQRLVAVLRADPLTPVLVPRLLALPEQCNDLLAWGSTPAEDRGLSRAEAEARLWTAALTTLAEEGVLDRRELLDTCVATLVRGGRPHHLGPYLQLLRLLALTGPETADRLADWAALAADAPGTVAAYAQERLRELADSGALDAARLADVSAAVLFRTEKKLVNAQLAELDRAIRRQPRDAGLLLPVAAGAFGHGDDAVRERAVKLVVRHVAHTGAAAREEIAGAAGGLGPLQRTRLADALGLPVAAPAPYAEHLPPAHVPQRPAPAPVDPAEVAAETAAVLAGDDSPAAFERALDGLVRAAYRDREGLAAALGSVSGRQRGEPVYVHRVPVHGGLGVVVNAVTGMLRGGWLRDVDRGLRGSTDWPHPGFAAVAMARVCEPARAIVKDRPLPYLLATPDCDDGTLEPATLMDRLRGYGETGHRPAEVDFAQALLRVRAAAATEADFAAARALPGPEGGRLAEWLDSGGLPVRPAEVRVDDLWTTDDSWWARRVRQHGLARARLGEARPLLDGFPDVVARLGRDFDPYRRGPGWRPAPPLRSWAYVLPHDPETVAACALPHIAAGAESEQRDAARDLPALIEAPGRPGPAVHLALAFALAARHQEDRLAAVDALLLLAARGDLDAERLGTDLALLLRLGAAKANRLAEAAGAAARTGAWRTVHTVLAAALPPVLEADQPPHGLGAVLAVAADCAERCGPDTLPEGVDRLAESAGPGQAVRQARRLLEAVISREPAM